MSKYDEVHCPVCGYYCLGKGGLGCIDKPFLCKLIVSAIPEAVTDDDFVVVSEEEE